MDENESSNDLSSIEKNRKERVGNMPDRKNYQLTKEGETALRQMVSEGLASKDIVTFEYLVTIGWLEVLPKDDVIAKIGKRKRMCDKC